MSHQTYQNGNKVHSVGWGPKWKGMFTHACTYTLHSSGVEQVRVFNATVVNEYQTLDSSATEFRLPQLTQKVVFQAS